VSEVVYVDTSAVLRAVLERGITPAIEKRLGEARYVLTSRLALVETARALHRLRQDGVSEAALTDAAGEADSIWARCTILELTPAVCELAAQVAPNRLLRTASQKPRRAGIHASSTLSISRRIPWFADNSEPISRC
jgi:predicted nucleic acid-binding protein